MEYEVAPQAEKPNATPEAQAAQLRSAQEVVKKLNPDVLFLQEIRDYKGVEEPCSVVPGLTVAATCIFSAPFRYRY